MLKKRQVRFYEDTYQRLTSLKGLKNISYDEIVEQLLDAAGVPPISYETVTLPTHSDK